MNIDPSTTKYLIQARLEAEGIVEKPDVVGAVFGQTEGLLGEELDLRDLQKSGRIGRIEVDVQSKKGRSEGTILIPSSLDQVETSILAAALETIDRVGPCKATIKVDKVEDTRVTKRNKIIERARSLLSSMVEESKTSGSDLLDEVRQSVQVSEIVSFGAERLPAGPNVADSDAISSVEGRQDVLNLLRSGIKNAIAVEGTNVPKTIQELSKERALTAFVDGDRGGDLILKELLQVAEVDFIARAPRGKEVEELTQKQIMKCLRNKIPADQYVEMYGLSGQVYKAESEFPEPKPAAGPQPRAEPRPEFRSEPREPREPREERPPAPLTPTTKVLNAKLEKYRDILLQLGGSSTARLLDEGDGVVTEVPVRDLVETLKTANQRRHFLLVGPPGTGKSMIAQALSLHLPSVTEEIRVVHNPENPERPLIEVKQRDEVLQEQNRLAGAEGDLIDPKEAPINVAERLGYKCVHCGTYSSPTDRMCPKCGRPKAASQANVGNPFGDLLGGIFEVTFAQLQGRDRVTTTRQQFGKEEVVVYERAGDMIRVLDQKALEKRREVEKESPRKVLVPITRRPFVLSTGASETELLGDVRHDPYGGHPQLGTQPYDRVVAGAIHEAHQGVLFIDELPLLGHLQRFILTAMQEKRFPISGRNPQSAGASVKVESVPCDFIFVGACNIQDLPHLLSHLRSRITGGGYEILVETTMPDTDANRVKLAQFVAQEIMVDKRIPAASQEAVGVVVEEARRRAKGIDNQEKGLSLRLRELGGLIRSAGDIAVTEQAKVIDADHVRRAVKVSRTIEDQIRERYGSYSAGVGTDMSSSQREASPYHYWNEHKADDVQGYQ